MEQEELYDDRGEHVEEYEEPDVDDADVRDQKLQALLEAKKALDHDLEEI